MPSTSGTGSSGAVPTAPKSKNVQLRVEQRPPLIKALAIGSSTGGPQALLKVLKTLPHNPRIPVFITQHMPPTFTKILAAQITEQTPWPCTEGLHDTPIKPGCAYIAPGDHHLGVNKDKIEINQNPPENFCRPAVDPMLRSLVAVYGKHVLAVILTGMGSDGRQGCEYVVEAGGSVIAQDEETSVVWGMPGAAALAGYCSAVLPIDKISGEISARLRRTV